MTKKQEFIESVKEKPLTTNRIDVEYNQRDFFSKYQIISYWSSAKEYRNLSYEKLSDIPVLSVTGLRSRWLADLSFDTTKFFVLVKSDTVLEVITGLRKISQIHSTIDNLERYDEAVKKRIIASLAINSLGKKRKDKMMYNDGSLLVSDDKNFLIPEEREEFVCLKIQVNDFLNLSASTTSFSHPKDIKTLKKHQYCVFQVGKLIDGMLSKCVKPIVIKKIEAENINLETLYIQKKKREGINNIVPYLPLDKENYTRGKMFVLSQIIDAVNEEYKGLLSLRFCTVSVKDYDEYRSEKDTNTFLAEYYSNKSIYCLNPFKNEGSEEVLNSFKDEVKGILNNKPLFVNEPSTGTMVVQLCKPSESKTDNDSYMAFPLELNEEHNALQHLTFHGKKMLDKMSKAKARRILLELIIKDSLLQHKMPKGLMKYIADWQFIKYKMHEDRILGGDMKVSAEGAIEIHNIGFDAADVRTDPTFFFYRELLYTDTQLFTGAGDFHAMKKGNNVYMIYDTEEIPIFDTDKLNEAYEDILNGVQNTTMFKRKKESHDYMQGYVGCTIWETEGLKGSNYPSYSYFSGVNNGSLRFYRDSESIDKMPRARRIFVLHAADEMAIETDIKEIINMLRYGFGRWNELMTYPLPFKFLTEHLDKTCLATFNKHWNKIGVKESQEDDPDNA